MLDHFHEVVERNLVIFCLLKKPFLSLGEAPKLIFVLNPNFRHALDFKMRMISIFSMDKSFFKDNLFIYQDRVQPDPSRVSDSSVYAETVISEVFVLMGEIGWCFSPLGKIHIFAINHFTLP